MALLGGAGLALVATIGLAWKWQLGIVRSVLAVAALAAGVAVALALGGDGLAPWQALLGEAVVTLALAAGLLLARFFRDPERTAPSSPDAIVSPADGAVVYVRRSERGRLPVATKNGRSYTVRDLVRTPLGAGEATVVGISLNLLDVHVNRAPIGGHVAIAERHGGGFGSLRIPEMAFENERATLLIRGPRLELAVVLIASRLVRRIALFVRAGQDVALGQRLGAIRFGSQVDLVLPARPDVRVLVAPGQRVRAGESIVAVSNPTTQAKGEIDEQARALALGDRRHVAAGAGDPRRRIRDHPAS